MMTVSRAEAVKLLSAGEYRIYEASRRGRIEDHEAKRLRTLISSARKRQDKYETTARQQKGEARGKRSPRDTRVAQGDDNTRRKQEIFQEMVGRFETALERAETREQPQRPIKRGTPKKELRSARRKAATKADAAASPTEKAGAKKKTTAKKAGAKKKTTAKKTGAKKKTSAKKTAPKKTTAKKAAPKKTAAKTAAKKAVMQKVTSARSGSPGALVGDALQRKPQQSATRAHLAHSTARGRRTQAKRDRRS